MQETIEILRLGGKSRRKFHKPPSHPSRWLVGGSSLLGNLLALLAGVSLGCMFISSRSPFFPVWLKTFHYKSSIFGGIFLFVFVFLKNLMPCI